MAAAMNSSSVLASNYALSSGSGSGSATEVKVNSLASPVCVSAAQPRKLPVIRSQLQQPSSSSSAHPAGRRAALFGLGAALLAATVSTNANANAGVIDDYLEKSKANKELNDKKRLATTGANFARAYTVEFGTCKFPENFTGCQDLAKQKKVPFLSEDLDIECQGKDIYKCGSNVFWKWNNRN